VDDLVLVEVVDGIDELDQEGCCYLLFESLALNYVLEELASFGVLHDKVDIEL
jgi:hypothetical protein